MGKLNENLISAGVINDFKEQIFRCNINVTDLCNQKCSYCINKDTHEKSTRVLSLKVLEEFIEDIASRIKDKVYFSVAGGEPFVYKHLDRLVELIDKNISAKYKQIRFLTNGSLLPASALPLYGIKGDIDLQYVISIHMDFMNINKFLGKMKDFPYQEDVLCKILMAPGQLEKSKRHLELLKDAGFKTYVSAVSGMPEPYTEEEKEFLRANTNVFVPIDLVNHYKDGTSISKADSDYHFNKGFFDYHGMACSAGITSLRLAPSGVVIPCFGIYSLPRDKRPVYDLTKRRLRDIPELEKPFICPSTYCFCSPFLSAAKWQPSNSGPEWLANQE